tara:strand:+ start:2917 stop:4236 length:1320 start_codon:yes stop_codon:yes gene_type:complete
MYFIIRRVVFLLVVILSATTTVRGDWPQWRGPDGTGIARDTAPTEWDEDTNIAWRSEIGGLGVSSPIVIGDLVVVTSQVGFADIRSGSHPTLAQNDAADKPLGGSRQNSSGQVAFLVEAFDRQSGVREWAYSLEARGTLESIHEKHNLASPSPVSDGERIYAMFATGQTVALAADGQEIWSRHLGEEYGAFQIVWGHSSSPTIYRDLLIIQCDHSSASYLLALDSVTGEERWKIDRGSGLRSYSTPVVIPGTAGDELIVNSSQRLDAYDPLTGTQLWFTGAPNQFPVPVATHANGNIYTSRGHRSGPYMKIRTGGRGDISHTHVDWHVATGAPYVSSILYYDGLIYMANGAGVFTCIEADSGNQVWRERLGGTYSASPVAAGDHIYFFSETGEAIVLAAGSEPLVVARNDLGNRILASPAISDQRLFVRTDRHLVAIGN